MKITTLMLIFIASITNLLASPAHTRMRVECIERYNWQERKCNVKNVNPSRVEYQMGANLNRIAPIGMAALYGTSQIIESTGITLGFLTGNERLTRPIDTRVEILDTLSDYIGRNNLNNCQQACLIKCSALAIMKYEDTDRTALLGINNLYSSGIGACTELSRLTVDIASYLGLDSGIVYGKGHAFNKMKINDEWYLEDSSYGQHNCDFFTDSQLSAHDLELANEAINN